VVDSKDPASGTLRTSQLPTKREAPRLRHRNSHTRTGKARLNRSPLPAGALAPLDRIPFRIRCRSWILMWSAAEESRT
jgi:hypothetical protein